MGAYPIADGRKRREKITGLPRPREKTGNTDNLNLGEDRKERVTYRSPEIVHRHYSYRFGFCDIRIAHGEKGQENTTNDIFNEINVQNRRSSIAEMIRIRG